MKHARLLPAMLILGICSLARVDAQPSKNKGAATPVEKDHAAKMARGLDLFKQHVRPLLIKHCLKCHGGEKTEAEFDITDRDLLIKGGYSGAAIVPGEPSRSLLVKLVSHQKKPHMPYEEDKLPAAAIEHIENWIANGAPFDKPLVERTDAAAWTRKTIDPVARKHWAYMPLSKAEPPQVSDNAWIKTPIDRFIMQRLDGAKLQPNPTASKRQLLRRAYLDLTGMPPTPEQVEVFLKDESPHAFADLVDKLLDSPHYGERWARHWLDLVRFAESHGFEHDYDRPTAYHYRDFVIKALNQGMPYDQFVKWQLAGDEIAPHDPLALMATGFLAAGVHSTQITKNEVEKHRYDELDDIVATTSTAMLGLTVGCARCHDHKYDAIPQADYYRMLSTFTTTVRSELDIALDTAGDRQRKEAFDREHMPLEGAVKKYEMEELPKRFAAWQQSGAKEPKPSVWVVPEIAKMTSSGEATLREQDDGSVLVSGKNPPIETLTFTLNTDLANIAALRIEALTHPSLVKNGPGRAANGNFALTDLKVTAAPRKGGSSETIKLIRPRATFEQKGLGVAGAIDVDPRVSGWAIDPEFGKDHAASFEFEKPVGEAGGTVLTVTMKFLNNTGHGMGRPRLSIAAVADGDLKAQPLNEIARRALDLPQEKRTPAQTAALLKWYRPFDAEWRQLNAKVQEHSKLAPKPSTVKALISSEGVPALRLHTQGEDFLKETHFLRRGDPNQKQGVAPAGFLQVATLAPSEAKWKAAGPQPTRLSYRRSTFANWLTDIDDGAGRLLARVIVNRLWQHHLGRGIVGTPSDFGVRGDSPTHPELLDYLAGELIKNGWRLKPIHKLIMTSAVYQQSSAANDLQRALDRDNRHFGRFNVRRLEAEAIRDSLLSSSGLLDPKMFGPGTLDEASKRRSIYFTMKRSRLIGSLIIFDAPDGTTGVGERPATTIAPQALHLLNNPQVRACARSLAKRVAGDARQAIERAYAALLTRKPTADELADGLAFLKEQATSYGKAPDAAELALADYCQTLMCLNEFVYVE